MVLLAPARLRDLLSKTLEYIETPDDYAVVLEGSIAEGFGNEASDIDYLVITADDRAHLTMPTILFLEGRRVEVRMRSAGQIRDQLESLRTIGARDAGRLSDDLLNRCQRFVNCFPLINEPLIESLRALLPRAELQRIAGAWFGHHARHSFRLGVALQLLGEPEHAALAERVALLRGVKSWLCGQGETYLDAKWLSAQFERASGATEIKAEFDALVERAPSLHATADFLTRLGLESAVQPEQVELRRRRGVTTWQLGSRVHVVRGRGEVFALSDRAGQVWRSLPFSTPLARTLAHGPDAMGPLIAQFHQLGLIELRWRKGPALAGVGSYTPAPASGSPFLSLDGLFVDDGGAADIALAPVQAGRFAACGMALIWGNLGVENAREDLVGALGRDQAGTATTAALRLVRSACQAVLAAHGVDPQPPIEEAPLVVGRIPYADPTVAKRASEISSRLLGHGFGSLPGGIAELDEFVRLVRRATRCEFPATFDSADGWGSTLDIGYDWVRLGAYLDSAFPVEEARDLLASGGAQPNLKPEAILSRTGPAR